MRKGSKLGSHDLSFTQVSDRLTVTVAVDLAYKILSVPLYRYTHRATDIWESGLVVGLRATTNDNGDKFQVSSQRGATGSVTEGTKSPRYVSPPNALPATHWNRRELDGPWINTRDGRIIPPRVTPGRVEAIPAASGHKVNRRRFSLSCDVQLSLWYDDRIGWLGLSSDKGGFTIRYECQI